MYPRIAGCFESLCSYRLEAVGTWFVSELFQTWWFSADSILR